MVNFVMTSAFAECAFGQKVARQLEAAVECAAQTYQDEVKQQRPVALNRAVGAACAALTASVNVISRFDRRDAILLNGYVNTGGAFANDTWRRRSC